MNNEQHLNKESVSVIKNKEGLGTIASGLGKLINSAAVMMVALSLVSLFSRACSPRAEKTPLAGTGPKQTEALAHKVDWSGVNEDVKTALAKARTAAHAQADYEMAQWIVSLKGRTDEQFLPWFFGYWNQKHIGMKSIGYWISNRKFLERFRGVQPSAAARITEDIQTEFAHRVLRPAIAQREIERMTKNMMRAYFATLQSQLQDIPQRHNIPQPEWEAYLQDLSGLAAVGRPDTVPLSLKTVYTAAGVGGILVLANTMHVIKHAVEGVGVRICAKKAAAVTSKGAAAVATKGAAATGTKIGTGKWFGPLVLLGVAVWDVCDHQASRSKNEPVLRDNIHDYFDQLHRLLLEDGEAGMMGVVNAIESTVVDRTRLDRAARHQGNAKKGGGQLTSSSRS